VTENWGGLPTASAAKEIRARILQDTGLTASAGVSYNRVFAKLASGQRKPNGKFVIYPMLVLIHVFLDIGRELPVGFGFIEIFLRDLVDFSPINSANRTR
jgi:impB/mucB/samB family protein